MSDDKPLELLTLEEQVPKLRMFLHPCRARLRPFLALFAIKNHLLSEAGLVVKNEPTVRWYQDRIVKAGVIASRWSVQRQLNQLAKFGIVDKTRARTPLLRDREGLPHIMRIEVCAYHLNTAIYPALEQALKQLLGVDSFAAITGLDDP